MNTSAFWQRLGLGLMAASAVMLAVSLSASVPAYRAYRADLEQRMAQVVAQPMSAKERRAALRALRTERTRVTSPAGHAIPLAGGFVTGLVMFRAARVRERAARLQTPDFRTRAFTARLPAARYQTFWGRFWAGWLDGFAFAPVTSLFALGQLHASPAVHIVCSSLQTCAWLAYSVWMLGSRGQTVGKWLCRVKVLDVGEGPLGWRQAILRDSVPVAVNLAALPFLVARAGADPAGAAGPAAIFASILSLWFLLEIVTMLANDKRRAVHDFIARSVVVRCAD